VISRASRNHWNAHELSFNGGFRRVGLPKAFANSHPELPMPPIELKSAQYLSPETPIDQSTHGDHQLPTRPSSSSLDSWHRAARWVSFCVAGAVIFCVIAFASALMAGIQLPKSRYPIDWWLWLCGGSSDQTFESFVKNAATSNQIDWEEQYRKSPAYQFKDLQFQNIPAYQFNQSPAVHFQPHR
jgi:hypothetical protein